MIKKSICFCCMTFLFMFTSFAQQNNYVLSQKDTLYWNSFIENKIDGILSDRNKLFENALSAHEKTIGVESNIISYSGVILTLISILIAIFSWFITSWINKKGREVSKIIATLKETQNKIEDVQQKIELDFKELIPAMNEFLKYIHNINAKTSELNFNFSIYKPTEEKKQIIGELFADIQILVRFSQNLSDKQKFILALYYFYNNQHDKAIDCLDKIDNLDSNCFFIKGLSYYNKDNNDVIKAKEYFVKTLEMEPHYASAYNYLQIIESDYGVPFNKDNKYLNEIVSKEREATDRLNYINNLEDPNDSWDFIEVIREIKILAGTQSRFIGYHQAIYQRPEFKEQIQALFEINGEIIYG